MSYDINLVDILTKATKSQATIYDLTAPLSESTPVIKLPNSHAQAWNFSRKLISKFDENGPEAFWYNFSMSEHTGTHLDAPIHWASCKDGLDVSKIPLEHLIAKAAVLDMSSYVKTDDFLLEQKHIENWCSQHGPLPENGWLLFRTGWDSRDGDIEKFLNNGHTPGISVECARWLAYETSIIGIGVETVGTDAGLAANFEQPFPVHWYLLGTGKYGLTQLKNLSLLPPQGALIIIAPLPIVGGTGSPSRVFAIVENKNFEEVLND